MTCWLGPPTGSAARAGTGSEVSGTTTGRSLPSPCRQAGRGGFAHTLLIRCNTGDPIRIGYFRIHAAIATPVTDMVAVAGIRWRIEECNKQSKNLLSLDQHQSEDLERVSSPWRPLPVRPRLRRHPPRPPAAPGHQPPHPRR